MHRIVAFSHTFERSSIIGQTRRQVPGRLLTVPGQNGGTVIRDHDVLITFFSHGQISISVLRQLRFVEKVPQLESVFATVIVYVPGCRDRSENNNEHGCHEEQLRCSYAACQPGTDAQPGVELF